MIHTGVDSPSSSRRSREARRRRAFLLVQCNRPIKVSQAISTSEKLERRVNLGMKIVQVSAEQHGIYLAKMGIVHCSPVLGVSDKWQ